jgi:hypothetical protein
MTWFPHALRNRIALVCFITSLTSFFAWNFLPNYHQGAAESNGLIFQYFWPKWWQMITNVRFGSSFFDYIELFFFSLFFGTIASNFITSAVFAIYWRELGKSELLRCLPFPFFALASIVMLMVILVHWTYPEASAIKHRIPLFYLLFYQFFSTTIGLFILRTAAEAK